MTLRWDHRHKVSATIRLFYLMGQGLTVRPWHLIVASLSRSPRNWVRPRLNRLIELQMEGSVGVATPNTIARDRQGPLARGRLRRTSPYAPTARPR